MRHYKKGRKLGKSASHTKAMKRSLVTALFLNDRIKTVEARAKEIRGDVDRVITWAKRGDLHSRRLAIKALNDKDLVAEIFEKVEQGLFADRNGGYTRIIKLGSRKGDNAPMVLMELCLEEVVHKEKVQVPTEVEEASVKEDPQDKAEKTEEEAKAEDDVEEAEVEEAEVDDETDAETEEDSEEAEDESEEESEDAEDEADSDEDASEEVSDEDSDDSNDSEEEKD